MIVPDWEISHSIDKCENFCSLLSDVLGCRILALTNMSLTVKVFYMKPQTFLLPYAWCHWTLLSQTIIWKLLPWYMGLALLCAVVNMSSLCFSGGVDGKYLSSGDCSKLFPCLHNYIVWVISIQEIKAYVFDLPVNTLALSILSSVWGTEIRVHISQHWEGVLSGSSDTCVCQVA